MGVIGGDYGGVVDSILLTCILGVLFTLAQYIEYYEASFTMADRVYGSVFFVSTGFHGLHVVVGTIFLVVGLIRCISGHFSGYHFMGLEAAIWY